MCPVFKKKAVAGSGDVRVAPLAAVVTSKVRIINGLSIDPTSVRGAKSSLNLNTRDTRHSEMSCGEASLKILAEISTSESSILLRALERLEGTEHCRKTLEFFVRCESDSVL